ncbi:hypothetical protein V8J82_15270 [Gymnodinialimonas sp. 2305UL16-5]|uniref:aldose epimerase family protein n=1 Tax=Gymnodinialimonas mytili TaxID=3126503 RepID=UPI0030A67A3E
MGRICSEYASGQHFLRATYEVDGEALRLNLTAQSDADTILNLCHPPYTNLSGVQSISDHRLQIFADRNLPSEAALIPTGQLADVAGSRFDFRKATRLPEGPFNNTCCLHKMP